MEGLGDTIKSLIGDVGDYLYRSQALDSSVQIAQINAGATTTAAVTEANSKQLLYLGIGVLGAAYLLFTLRRMEA